MPRPAAAGERAAQALGVDGEALFRQPLEGPELAAEDPGKHPQRLVGGGFRGHARPAEERQAQHQHGRARADGGDHLLGGHAEVCAEAFLQARQGVGVGEAEVGVLGPEEPGVGRGIPEEIRE